MRLELNLSEKVENLNIEDIRKVFSTLESPRCTRKTFKDINQEKGLTIILDLTLLYKENGEIVRCFYVALTR